MIKLKNRIAEILIEHNMSQNELARKLDTNQQQVNNWCRNKYNPRDGYLVKIMEIFNIADPEEIFYIHKTKGV